MSLILLFLALFIGINVRYSIIVGIIEIIALLVFAFFKRSKKVMLLAFISFLVGVGISFIRPTSTRSSFQGMVVEVKENYYIISSSFERFYVSEPDNYHEVGDILLLDADKEELDFVTLESEFDFKDFLNKKGVYYQLLVKKTEVKFSNPIRLNKYKRLFLEKFDENSRGLVGSILFGINKESELVDVSRNLHLSRVVSASGIYLFFFFKLIKWLLSVFIKKDKIVDLLSVILFLPYVILTFPKFITLRFFVLQLAKFINTYPLKGRFRYIDIVSISGILFLLIDYHLAYQDGFILAYLITLLSIFFNSSFSIKPKILKRGVLLLAIAISFIPFTTRYYNEISIFSFPLQLLLTPIYILIFVLAVLSFAGVPLFSVIGAITAFMIKALNFISPTMIKIYVYPYSNLSLLLFELIFYITLYFLSIRLRPVKNLSLVFLTLSLSLHIIPLRLFIKDYVSFINVGQGDSTLIKYKNSTVLIDTGGNKNKDIATNVLIPYFKKNQIYHVDLLITTHDDFDHSGAVKSLIRNFTVKEYIKDYTKFPININGLELTNYNIYPDLWSEENDRSLVLGFKINQYNYLVMGDAPIKIEKEIIKNNEYIPCDILKVGHHGSKTSTSEEFVKYLSPTIGVISCGKNNYYGHPHSVVLGILRKYDVVIRRTDLESTITF